MPNTKISNLTSAGALAGTEVLPIVQTGSTVKTTVQDIANLAPSSLMYTYYSAQFSIMSGNLNATEINNTLGVTITPSLSSNTIIFTAATGTPFTVGKTYVTCTPFQVLPQAGGTAMAIVGRIATGNSAIILYFYDYLGANFNFALANSRNSMVNIQVYP